MKISKMGPSMDSVYSKKFLMKVNQDKVVYGVCKGISVFLDKDVRKVRLSMLSLCFLLGMGLLIYTLLAILMPKESELEKIMEYKIVEAELKLTKNNKDCYWLGVCGGIARYWDLDPTSVRFMWVLLVILLFGLPIPFYFIASLFMPRHQYSF
jgi:phage shock protein C